jgi:hypothetical protein
MNPIHVTLKMANYIADPFWPSRNACINIEKKSGVNRQKSEEKRVQALKAECNKQGITYERYLELKEDAKTQWYRNKDGFIVIPRHHIAGTIVQTIGTAPKALRGIFSRDNLRALVQIGDFATTLKDSDGVFARFVKLDGTNQRNWQENGFIGQYLDMGQPFEAVGVIACQDDKQIQTIKACFTQAIEDTGIGASRKMGFGRGKIISWS